MFTTMRQQSRNGLRLPIYHRNQDQQRWVASKLRTANLIRSLWSAASPKQRREPAFLCLLVQCGWTNAGGAKGRESTRKWRNRAIANFLKVAYRSDRQLATDLLSRLPALNSSKALSLLKAHTGITHYYNAFRPATLRFVKQNSEYIEGAFRKVAAAPADRGSKVVRVADLIASLGDIRAAKRRISPFNGLTPTLACLDPQRRFPIMNDRTRSLLRFIGERPNAAGVVALYKLIGRDNDVRNSFELDAYAFGEKFPRVRARGRVASASLELRDVGFKSEINSIAKIQATRTTITKLHNKLTNRLNEYLLWRQMTAKESRFDALVTGYKTGRDLLIEAKTASDGPSGRSQIRQAIGQLYDYRFSFLPGHRVDLAILLAEKPSIHVQELLASLEIELLWFEGKRLNGTIQL